MNWIKDFFNKIRHNYYTIAKVVAFLVAIVLVCWLMPRTGKFKYEYQLSKPWQHRPCMRRLTFLFIRITKP